MFAHGEIWLFPTDTSFGLGVRCDDPDMLDAMHALKGRKPGQYFSLMVKDMAMLHHYAHVPEEIDAAWFLETPRTAILTPKNTLPCSQHWPESAVAFRVTTRPDVAAAIQVPITATSANASGQPPCFRVGDAQLLWGNQIQYPETPQTLLERPPSEIWDFTVLPPKKVR